MPDDTTREDTSSATTSASGAGEHTGRPSQRQGADEKAQPRSRRRGSRGGRRRGSRPAKASGAATATGLSSDGSSGRARVADATAKKPKVGSTRTAADAERTATKPAAAKPAAAKPKVGDTRPAPEIAAPERTRRRRGGRGGRRRRPAGERPPVQKDDRSRPTGRYLMCVHIKKGVATHVALLEGRQLVEHYVSQPQDETIHIHGNIYLGKVQNVLPGMEAAFVDIGTPKNGVLYRRDASYDESEFEGGRPRIERMLKNGQSVVVQVTKNPIGSKGARLTQDVSLAGRYVVLVPGQRETFGISKRLPDDERKRLRSVLEEIRPPDAGVIIRTAAVGVSAEELARDVRRLKSQWGEIVKQARGKPPKLAYKEPDLAIRLIREEFNREYRGVLIDDLQLYDEVRSYVENVSPDLADRIEYYDDELPLFERYHVEEQLQKALDRKVWLPSGGSLVIERTEAFTVIDVNTGKNVGSSTLEDTVYQNNLEAGEEIARQLRLRDIGGIIVIDFIDMEVEKNRTDVLRVFKEALGRDKTRTQVFEISELGLVEMTRKRVAEDLVESFSQTCPSCSGRGLVIDEDLL